MRVLLPLPDRDFDTTEVAVPWHVLTDAGHQVVFATERGDGAPQCDPLLLTGVLFGQLGAATDAKDLYRRMTTAAEFCRPVSWRDIDATEFDGLLLPGGHAPGMRQYLGATDLQRQVAAFWSTRRPVGAICHGVLVLARTLDPGTGRSVLYDKRTTCLPKYMERSAFWLTAWRRGRYYRTYPRYVEDEVVAALRDPGQYVRGPRVVSRRGTASDDAPAFVVEDGRYVSARWPGDAWLFARRLATQLSQQVQP